MELLKDLKSDFTLNTNIFKKVLAYNTPKTHTYKKQLSQAEMVLPLSIDFPFLGSL